MVRLEQPDVAYIVHCFAVYFLHGYTQFFDPILFVQSTLLTFLFHSIKFENLYSPYGKYRNKNVNEQHRNIYIHKLLNC